MDSDAFQVLFSFFLLLFWAVGSIIVGSAAVWVILSGFFQLEFWVSVLGVIVLFGVCILAGYSDSIRLPSFMRSNPWGRGLLFFSIVLTILTIIALVMISNKMVFLSAV